MMKVLIYIWFWECTCKFCLDSWKCTYMSYNYCLHMRWTLKVVKPPGKTTSQGLTTWCSPHIKAINVLLYWNYKMFKNLNVLLSWVVDQATIYYCLPLHNIYLGCPLCTFPLHQIFPKTSKLSYYFYIVDWLIGV